MSGKRIVVLTAREQDGLDVHTTVMRLSVDNEMCPDDEAVLLALREAARDYCKTADGLKLYEGNCCCFNYGDVYDIPNNLLKAHGLENIDDCTEAIEVDFNEQLVSEEDVRNEAIDH